MITVSFAVTCPATTVGPDTLFAYDTRELGGAQSLDLTPGTAAAASSLEIWNPSTQIDYGGPYQTYQGTRDCTVNVDGVNRAVSRPFTLTVDPGDTRGEGHLFTWPAFSYSVDVPGLGTIQVSSQPSTSLGAPVAAGPVAAPFPGTTTALLSLPVPVLLTIPVVLDAPGVGGSHYTSDLVLVNRSPEDTRLQMAYTPAPGTAGTSGVASETLPAGHEFRVPDVVQYLRTKGVSLPTGSGTIAGTLGVTFIDVMDPSVVFAGSRTSTPNPDLSVGGSFGLFAPGIPPDGVEIATATIYGLREDDAFRSNLAILDVPTGTGPPALSLQIWDGDTGQPAGAPIPYALQPGEWHQFNALLAQTGVKNGYVTVARTGGGTDGFWAYGVVNDGGTGGGGTSDGSFIGPDASDGLVPLILRTESGVPFTSELILANPTDAGVNAVLTYTPAGELAAGTSVTTSVPLGPGRQIRIPDVVTYFQTTLGLPLPSAASQGGTLYVSNAVALVRTSSPNPDTGIGGSFGLSYPAYGQAGRATAEAWVYGLRQDSSARSNLAIADARIGSPDVVDYQVEVYDSVSGNAAPVATLGPFHLTGGQWYQVNGVLSEARLSSGYVRVSSLSGFSDFVAYGVINDGSAPGRGTSDGCFVPASP